MEGDVMPSVLAGGSRHYKCLIVCTITVSKELEESSDVGTVHLPDVLLVVVVTVPCEVKDELYWSEEVPFSVTGDNLITYILYQFLHAGTQKTVTSADIDFSHTPTPGKNTLSMVIEVTISGSG